MVHIMFGEFFGTSHYLFPDQYILTKRLRTLFVREKVLALSPIALAGSKLSRSFLETVYLYLKVILIEDMSVIVTFGHEFECGCFFLSDATCPVVKVCIVFLLVFFFPPKIFISFA